jgi:hypothetical protein
MSLDPIIFRVCIAELVKTADVLSTVSRGARSAAGHFGDALKWGWHNADPAAAGVGRTGWRWAEKGLGRYMPGPKTLTALSTATALPSLLRPQDSSGQDRSPAQRVSEFAGQSLGGLAAGGAAMKALRGRSNWLQIPATIAASMGGSVAGQQLAKAPFTLKRKLLHPRQAPAPGMQTEEPGQNQAPYGVHSPHAVEGQAALL